MNLNKLKEKCEVLSKMIIALCKIYNDKSTTEDQKSLIETVIGAGIWYLPQDRSLWTGEISKEALDYLKNGKKISQLTKEHLYPRKISARELLTINLQLTKLKEGLFKLYLEKYGKFRYVTSKENSRLKNYQKIGCFNNSDESYKKAEITLLKSSWNELIKIEAEMKGKR